MREGGLLEGKVLVAKTGTLYTRLGGETGRCSQSYAKNLICHVGGGGERENATGQVRWVVVVVMCAAREGED